MNNTQRQAMKLPYGIANFEKIRTEDYFYVDKTRYIEILENLPESHVVILRSRCFGKTLFAEQFLKGLSNRDYERFDEKYIKLVMLSLLSNVDLYIAHSEYEVSADGYVDLFLQAAYEPEHSAHYFIELKYAKAKASKKMLDAKEEEGLAAMQTYLQSKSARIFKHLHAYVFVFRKDQCVRQMRCN